MPTTPLFEIELLERGESSQEASRKTSKLASSHSVRKNWASPCSTRSAAYGKMARELSKQWPRNRPSRTESKILGRGQNSSDEICLQVVNSHHPLSSPSLYWIKISVLIWQDQSGRIVQDHKFIPLPPTGHSNTQQQQNSIYSALLIQYGRRRREGYIEKRFYLGFFYDHILY